MASCRPKPHRGRVFAAAGGRHDGEEEDGRTETEGWKHKNRDIEGKMRDQRRGVKASKVTAASFWCWRESLWRSCSTFVTVRRSDFCVVVRLTKAKKANVWQMRCPGVTPRNVHTTGAKISRRLIKAEAKLQRTATGSNVVISDLCHLLFCWCCNYFYTTFHPS